jgi:hypothetical protein
MKCGNDLDCLRVYTIPLPVDRRCNLERISTIRDFRLPPLCRRDLRSSGMLGSEYRYTKLSNSVQHRRYFDKTDNVYKMLSSNVSNFRTRTRCRLFHVSSADSYFSQFTDNLHVQKCGTMADMRFSYLAQHEIKEISFY